MLVNTDSITRRMIHLVNSWVVIVLVTIIEDF